MVQTAVGGEGKGSSPSASAYNIALECARVTENEVTAYFPKHEGHQGITVCFIFPSCEPGRILTENRSALWAGCIKPHTHVL